MTKIETILFLAPALLGTACAGARASGPEAWRGEGALFDRSGALQGHYKVELTRRPDGEDAYLQDVKVLIPERQPMHFQQRLVMSDDGFAIQSETGDGGGYDLGEGFVTTYTVNEEGVAFASSIFIEDDAMRILRYELKDGDTVHFYRETLRRQ